MDKFKLILPISDNLIDIVKASTEGVWATRIEENLYRLNNIPFFTSGFSAGDEIYTEHLSKPVNTFDIITPSNNSTVLVISQIESHWKQVKKLCQNNDCEAESALSRLSNAISIPSTVSVTSLINQLESLEKVQKSWIILTSNRH